MFVPRQLCILLLILIRAVVAMGLHFVLTAKSASDATRSRQDALITGAARGMGAAEARVFTREGAPIAICDVRDEQTSAVAEESAAGAAQPRPYHLDIPSDREWAAVTARIWSGLGGLDTCRYWPRSREQGRARGRDRGYTAKARTGSRARAHRL